MRKDRLFGNLILMLTALIWGTAFAFQRAGMEQIGPLTFVASRMTLSAAAVGLAALLRGRHAPRQKTESRADIRRTVTGGICCGTVLALASIFQQSGIVYTTAGKAGFITALYILIVPVINHVIFKKRSTWIVWLSVLLGVAGMYLLCMKESLSLSTGDALICACAALFSAHILCCDRFVSGSDPVRISAVQFITATLISWIAAFMLETPSLKSIVPAAAPILYCGIMSGGVGYTLQLVAQKRTDPTVASLLMSFEAVFAVIAGALLLHEKMSARELLGCAVMFVAIIAVQLPAARKDETEI
ncbi:MAG: DMT family transporter [Clostridiales bacterium]|nr:DMT family transporter [Clostridiales bacterium]